MAPVFSRWSRRFLQWWPLFQSRIIISRIIWTSVGVGFAFLAIRRIARIPISRGRLLAPLYARAFFIETKWDWPWCKDHSQMAVVQLEDDNDAQPYQFTPLGQPREIRLLRIFCQGYPERFICELIPVSLDDLPTQYLAFSYTWGDPTPYSTVKFKNGKVLGITKTVSIIFDIIFSRSRSLHVWIDSICINQSDTDEKSSQVKLMSEIYSKAQQVVISLGEETDGIRRAMDFIEHLRLTFRACGLALDSNDVIAPEDIQRKGNFDRSTPGLVAMSELLSRPWFTRIWVIQEVVVASSNPVFICGNRAVAWEDLVYIAMQMSQHSLWRFLSISDDLELSDLGPGGGLRSLVGMHMARAMKQLQRSENFQDTLLTYSSFNSTDPRDRVFALLGIAMDTKDVGLEPDYNDSVEQVYTKTAIHLLRRDSFMTILHFAGIGNPRKRPNLPSWVSEWDSTEGHPFNLGALQRVGPKYRAAGSTIRNIRSLDTETLAIDGIILDTVRNISSTRETTDAAWLQEHEQLIEEINPAFKDPSTLYPGTAQNWTEAYWRTLIANVAMDQGEGSPPSTYRQYFNFFKREIQSGTPFDDIDSRALAESVQKANLFYTMYGVVSLYRRFFTTQNGYIGLTTSGTQIGDVVCIFLGGVTPFIIREKVASPNTCRKHVWNLVGEAYVHGLLDGQGLDMGEAKEIALV